MGRCLGRDGVNRTRSDPVAALCSGNLVWVGVPFHNLFVLSQKTFSVMSKLSRAYNQEDEKIARYAKALGHPARIVILRFLARQNSCFAGDIANQLPIAASTVSQHLSELKDAGLIQGEVLPPMIKYCINRANWAEAKVIFSDFWADEPKAADEKVNSALKCCS